MPKANAELIDPKDEGHRPPLLRQPVFDADALARADDALKSMSGSFQQWLEADVERLHGARLAAQTSGWSIDGLEALMGVAHDVKGMGATYDYPIITQIAASLCRLIETADGQVAARADPGLVNAHVDAIRAAARDQIRTDAHPLGRALLRTLEDRVSRLGVAPR